MRPVIDGYLRLERKELWSTVNHDEFSQRGWVPKTDEAKTNFLRGVAKDLCWMDEEARGKALVSVEEIIYSHAIGIDSDNTAIRQWSGLQSSGHTETRSCTRHPQLAPKHTLGIECQISDCQGEQLNRLLAGYFDRVKQALEMQFPDGPSDRHAWAADAGEHGREVYSDDDNNVDIQQQRLVRFQHLA